MNDTTFKNYQKRMLHAMQSPNDQGNDPFTKLSIILENLKSFVDNSVSYSQTIFKQEIKKQFENVDSSDETAKMVQETLSNSCSTKNEALKTLQELCSMVTPFSRQLNSWSAVASIANEYMAEIEKSIFHSK